MGLTFIDGVISGLNRKKAEVRFLIDSGATYTLLANEHWKAIGLVAKRAMEFTLGDGTVLRRQVSECHISLSEGEGHTPVVLGEGEDESLLGVVTLEILGLKLNPFTRTLEPMKMMLGEAGSQRSEVRLNISDMSLTKTYGKRRRGKATLQEADAFLRLVIVLRGNKPFLPRGVHRFTSFEESFRWSMRMMARNSNQDRQQ